MATHVLCIILALQVVFGRENYYRSEGFMNHLNAGMKLAQNLLGSESTALKVADFVVRAFHTSRTPTGAGAVGERRPALGNRRDQTLANEEESLEIWPNLHEASPAAPAPWQYLMRLLGLQPNQLSAVAVNAVVFVAQMILSFLAGPRRPSKLANQSDDPTDWILNRKSKKLQQIIETAKNESLSELVEDLVTRYGTREETSCIRLLVCKVTPFVSRMQHAVFGDGGRSGFKKATGASSVLYRHLPSNEEIRIRSDFCEKRYLDCELNE